MPKNTSKKKISKPFIVCCAGMTIDGRTVSEQDILDMAQTYSIERYAARIWLEHIRGYTADSIFNAHGDVIELGTTKNIDKELCLTARLIPLDNLLSMNKKSQKMYTSVEMRRNYRDSGKTYLVGLAVTDSPASVSTERLEFSLKHPDLFSDHDQPGDRLFTPFIERDSIEFTEQQTDEISVDDSQYDQSTSGDPQNAIQAFDKKFNALMTISVELTAGQKRMDGKLDKMSEKMAGIDQLRTELEGQQMPGYKVPGIHTGGSATEFTDC